MKKTAALIEKLIRLANGDALPASSLKGDWFEQMQDDGILLATAHGSRKSLRASDGMYLRQYVASQFDINDLEQTRIAFSDEDASRASLVAATGDSKFLSRRTFKGFLVNSYQPVAAVLNGQEITIHPTEGSFMFVADYQHFAIPQDVVVVGVENAENFRYVALQKYLFARYGRVLFVSRYPQDQKKDLIKWLQSIPNRYVHFGDLDLAGIAIYESEYYHHLGNKSSLFIPDDFEQRISNGNTERYNAQLPQYGKMKVEDKRVQPLLDSIHLHHKGYDQEGYIKKKTKNMSEKQKYIDFEAYERVAEPHKRERVSAWRTAIGLQDVDGLRVSDYLKEIAVKHIEGDITIDEVREQLQSYYVNKTTHDADDAEKEEADRVAANITKLLNEKSFSLTPLEFLNIHRHLFEGVFKHAGEIRPYDISKKEWVLQGDTVVYGRAADIHEALKYDIQTERDFSYKGLTTDEIISHVVDFVTLLWQNHPFREGNTRTTAVFIIKYFRSCGFNVNNELFADNSWYFRNALVRANYSNPQKGIQPDRSFLVKFFRNLLLGENNELKNRYMLIGYKDEENDAHTSTRTSTHASSIDIQPSSENVRRLVLAIGKEEMSVKSMMEAVGLKNRPNFMDYSLAPAIREGFVCMKYPTNPHHPRQRYLLTLKGLMLLDDNNS